MDVFKRLQTLFQHKAAIFIIVALESVFIFLLILAAILPKETFQQIKALIHLNVFKLFCGAVSLVIIRCASLLIRKRTDARYLQAAPCLILILIFSYRLSSNQQYNWGVDDSFYYSYIPSAVIDRDLDLRNQYERCGLMKHLDNRFLQDQTPRGYLKNIYPVGLSLFSAPFFLAGHIVAHIFSLPVDGYSKPYTGAVLIGQMIYFSFGLYLATVFASYFYRKWTAAFATLVLLLSTPPLYFFLKVQTFSTEPLSMALIAALLVGAYQFVCFKSSGWGFLCGLLSGLMTIVRFQNLVFVLLPASVLFTSMLRDRSRREFRISILFATGFIIGFLPQMLAWHIIYGRWIVNTSEGLLPWWNKPFLLETLFSARNGLFPWTPIVLFCLCGLALFIKKNRYWSSWLIVLFILMTYLSASQRDWWGSMSFGARRFASSFIIFSVGLTAICSYRWRRFKAMGLMFVFAGAFFFIAYTFKLGAAFDRGEIPGAHAPQFSKVFRGAFNFPYRLVAYASQFPVQLAYRIRYGTRMYGPLNDFFIGEDIFYFQQHSIDFPVDENPMFDRASFQHSIELTITPEKPAALYVPLFFKRNIDLVMELRSAKTNFGQARCKLMIDGDEIVSKKITQSPANINFRIPRAIYKSEINILILQVESPNRSAVSASISEIVFRPFNPNVRDY